MSVAQQCCLADLLCSRFHLIAIESGRLKSNVCKAIRMLQDTSNLLHTHLALAGTRFAYHLTLIHMVQDTNKVLAIKRSMVPLFNTYYYGAGYQ